VSRYRVRAFSGALWALLAADVAQSQVLPGDPVDTGIGAAVRNSQSRPLLGISRDRQKYIYEPEAARSTGSARQSPRDPWAGLRTAPIDDPTGRHRPQ
jgi:hypothetical protein